MGLPDLIALDCPVESAEGVGIVSFYTRLRAAAERIGRWNRGRERKDRDHGVDRSNSSTTKSEINASLEVTIPVQSSDSTEHIGRHSDAQSVSFVIRSDHIVLDSDPVSVFAVGRP